MYTYHQKPKSAQVQKKSSDLKIGAPDDKYEQEADQVAAQVMRMPEPAPPIQRQCDDCEEEEQVQRKCEDCEEEQVQRKCETCEAEEQMQRKPLSEQISMVRRQDDDQPLQMKATGVPDIQPDFESGLKQSKGSGQPLSGATKSFMESRIGADFSDVRIHAGGNAAKMSSQISAQAFTHGKDVFFNQGKFQPNSHSGKALLAHELTHVVQQTGSGKKIQRSPAQECAIAADEHMLKNGRTDAPVCAPPPAANTVGNIVEKRIYKQFNFLEYGHGGKLAEVRVPGGNKNSEKR